MNNVMRTAFRLGLGLMIAALAVMCLTAYGTAEFWVCCITAVLDGLFCIGLLVAAHFRRK